MSSVFLSFSNYRMRGLLVGFHFCPVLLSGVALFLVAFSSSARTDLSRNEVFENVNISSVMGENSDRMPPLISLWNNLTILLIGSQFSILPLLYSATTDPP